MHYNNNLPAVVDQGGGRKKDLAEHITAIRALGKQTIANIIEIGRHLTKCRDIVGARNFGNWLNREFPRIGQRTAQRFMNVHELAAKNDNLSFSELPVSALYLLAAPSTPEPVRDEILERAEAGKKMSVSEVKRVIKEATENTVETTEMPPFQRRPRRRNAVHERWLREFKEHNAHQAAGLIARIGTDHTQAVGEVIYDSDHAWGEGMVEAIRIALNLGEDWPTVIEDDEEADPQPDPSEPASPLPANGGAS
jgi:Protein of unknown function (DUF3102)